MNERGDREAPVCAYCGEHDAWPRHFCLIRMTQAKGPNPAPFQCGYSLEADARLQKTFDAFAGEIREAKRRALARGAAAVGGVDGRE